MLSNIHLYNWLAEQAVHCSNIYLNLICVKSFCFRTPLRLISLILSQMNSHSIWENSMGFGPVSVTPGLVTHMEVRLHSLSGFLKTPGTHA